MSKSAFSQGFDPQHQQKIEELVAIAKEQGFITYEEINEILPMTFDSAEQIDQVLIFLSGMDIQILNQSEVERQKERKKEAKEMESLPKRMEGSSDDQKSLELIKLINSGGAVEVHLLSYEELDSVFKVLWGNVGVRISGKYKETYFLLKERFAFLKSIQGKDAA